MIPPTASPTSKPELIPKPSEENIRSASSTYAKLQAAMKLDTLDKLMEFTNYLKKSAREILDINKLIKDQDENAWKAFVMQAHHNHPLLHNYESGWPVEAFMERFLLQRSRARLHSMRNKQRQEIHPQRSPSAPIGEKQKKKKVGRPPSMKKSSKNCSVGSRSSGEKLDLSSSQPDALLDKEEKDETYAALATSLKSCNLEYLLPVIMQEGIDSDVKFLGFMAWPSQMRDNYLLHLVNANKLKSFDYEMFADALRVLPTTTTLDTYPEPTKSSSGLTLEQFLREQRPNLEYLLSLFLREGIDGPDKFAVMAQQWDDRRRCDYINRLVGQGILKSFEAETLRQGFERCK